MVKYPDGLPAHGPVAHPSIYRAQRRVTIYRAQRRVTSFIKTDAEDACLHIYILKKNLGNEFTWPKINSHVLVVVYISISWFYGLLTFPSDSLPSSFAFFSVNFLSLFNVVVKLGQL